MSVSVFKFGPICKDTLQISLDKEMAAHSCLENPRDGEAWWAAVSGVAQSRTRLKQLSSSKDTSQIGLGFMLMTSFGLDYLCKYLISKYNILRY